MPRPSRNASVSADPSVDRAWLAPVLLVLMILAAYSNSFSGAFVFDDLANIQQNNSIRSLVPLKGVLFPDRIGSTIEARPLVNLSFALNYAAGGLKVAGYHLVNLAIHILATLCLLAIVRRTLLLPGWPESVHQNAATLSFIVASIWALHPLQVAAVTYLSQRAESLMGLFYLLTLYCSMRAATSKAALRWSTAAVIACAAGMATKEVMVSAPLIVVLYDRVFLFSSFKAIPRQRKFLYVALACTLLLLLALVAPSSTRTGTAGLGQGVSSWDYLLTQAAAIVHYLRLTLWPDVLVLDYGRGIVRQPGDVWPQGLLMLGLLAATALSWFKWPTIGFLATWFFAVLAPSSSVVPIITQTMAEHRMYLALAPLVMVLVIAGQAAWQRLALHADPSQRSSPPWVPALVIVTIVLALAARTYTRNADYFSAPNLWAQVTRDWPSNQRAWAWMADYWMNQGDFALAAQNYEKAQELGPLHAPVRAELHNARGLTFQHQGKYDQAIVEFSRAISLNPDWRALNNRAVAYRSLGRYREALGDYNRAIEVNSELAAAWYGRAVVRRQLGDLDQALADFNRAIELRPNLAEAYHDRGALRQSRREWDAALRDYSAAISLSPQHPLPWFNRGTVYQHLEKHKEAMADFTRALLLDPRDGQALLNRAACYLSLGNARLAKVDVDQARQLGFEPDPELLKKLSHATPGKGNANP